jgi:hypothetical protein
LTVKVGLVLSLAGLAGAAGGTLWAFLPMLPAAVKENAEKRAAIEASVHYAGCDEVRLLGRAPLYAGQPGYSIDMDGDGDGIACESHRY